MLFQVKSGLKGYLVQVSRRITYVTVSVLLSVTLVGCSSVPIAQPSAQPKTQNTLFPSTTNSSTTTPARPPISQWVPSGYISGDGIAAKGMAYQWQTAAQNPTLQKAWCGGFENVYVCQFLSVIVNESCAPQASLQIFDQNGNVVSQAQTGDQNSSNPVPLMAGQKTVLVFRLEKQYPKTKLTYVSC